mmetsp:Transcript_51350/g.85155  ORF Transcript_51350/g.85155 Transcript_51350/m.85155 type:complete len:159 (+) Transcript_51350:25-501(+)
MSKRVNTTRIKQLRSFERYVPRQPPKGAMRHLTAKEIHRCRELIPRAMDDKACTVEKETVLRCWKIHGAEEVDPTHPCHTAESNYTVCVRRNVGKGLLRNKDIGGDFILTYMWKFMRPLREDDNRHVSYANKAQDCNKGKSKKKMMWHGGKPRIHRKY